MASLFVISRFKENTATISLQRICWWIQTDAPSWIVLQLPGDALGNVAILKSRLLESRRHQWYVLLMVRMIQRLGNRSFVMAVERKVT